VAVKKASEIAKSFGAKMAVLLPVSGAFHSPLVKSAAYKIAEFLETVQLNEPKKPIISNVLASPVEDKNQIKDLLIKQIYSPVRWRETLGFLEQNGVEKMYEIGSKSVLCGLCKRTSKTIQPISIETKSDIIQHFTSL
jgi:[acyl-carrier-protein] S-malonyltransferase